MCKKTEDITISIKYYYKILSNFEVHDLRRKHDAYLNEYADFPEPHLWKLFTHLVFQERLIKKGGIWKIDQNCEIWYMWHWFCGVQKLIVTSFRGISRTPETSIIDFLVTVVNGIN